MPAPATVLVVRPRAQAGAWVDSFVAAGLAARALPLVGIEPAPDPGAVLAARAALARCAPGQAEPLAVFVSPNAVEGFCAAAPGAPWPAQAWAGATGPGTVAALVAAGVAPARIVAPPVAAGRFDSEALWSCLAGWHWPGRQVWLVRGNGGREWLADQLRAAGAEVHAVQAYSRVRPRLDAEEQALLAQAQARPADWIWLFSSSEAVAQLQALLPGADWRSARALATHARIAESALAAGFGRVDVVAPTQQAVIAALGR